MVVTKEFLKSRNVPDIGSIKISSENYINESKNLTQEKIESIMFPEVPSNNRNTITLSKTLQQVKEILFSKGVSVSELVEHPFWEGVQNTSNLPKVCFSQQ